MSRKKKTRTGPRFQWIRNLEWPTIRRGLIAFAWIASIGGLIAAAIYGIPRMEAYAVAHTQVHVSDIEIRFVDPPAWLQGELEERILYAARVHLTDQPLVRTHAGQRDLRAARAELMNTGWFDEVKQIRRVHVGLVEVDAEFVDPFALIRNHEGDNLVDSQGRLLPRTFPEGEAQQFMVIIGARFDRPARPGLQWEGADVAAALRLLHIIEKQPWREQVRMIDITGQSRAVATGTIKLITNRGSWILWGSPPGREAAMEALVDRKLQFLNHNHREFGHIDGNHRGEVDITDHKRVMNR